MGAEQVTRLAEVMDAEAAIREAVQVLSGLALAPLTEGATTAPVGKPEAPKPDASKPTGDKFEPCFRFVMRKDVEGGFVNDPDDPGGATNKGITIGTLRAWRGKPNVTVDDVMNLTDAEAKEIYRAEYYNKIRGDDLPLGVHLVAFDMAVNAGPGRSVKLLQQIAGVPVDGGMGPVTLAALGKFDPVTLVEKFSIAREVYYRSLEKAKYINGWLRRVDNAELAAKQLMGVLK